MRYSALLSLSLLLAGSCVADGSKIDFAKDIAPIFEQHCVRCHSPNNREGDISLATIDDLLAGEHIVAGKPEESTLVDLITGIDGEPPQMPQESEALSREQVEAVRRWISDGAIWPQEVVVREKSKADESWWSLQPLSSGDDSSGANPRTIDDFIRKQLDQRGLSMSPPADRRTLIRRATYDLTGLPPSPEQVEEFVESSDPGAYEKLIERLLASPHYGERWGRHWLDVVRFGESNGFERNVIINNLWPFRDYVIRSINEDKPFDQFIREHLAGDVIDKDNLDTAVATAFLVSGPYDDVGNQDAAQAAQIRANTLDEIISATSQAFLGMTVGCSRCHDHKFDPITQEDYYGLYATFAGIRHGAVPLATKEFRSSRDEKLKPLNQRISTLDKAIKELDANVLKRAKEKLPEYQALWPREPVDRTRTEDRFEPIMAKFVRLICEAQDSNPASTSGFRIDEFEVWSADSPPKNVALASAGGKATGKARAIEDFAGAYGAHHAIDGKAGARFIATGSDLTIELANPTKIERVVFSSARGESTPEHRKFIFVAEYRIEVSEDGKAWETVASSQDRMPGKSPQLLNHRLARLETTDADRAAKNKLTKERASVNREIRAIPAPPSVWIGKRVASDAKGPFHIFLGGSPQKKGNEIVPASLRVLGDSSPQSYRLSADADEAQRRIKLAQWIVAPENPLTARVLANRIWHYHFGTGIVDTPSDFGYMGGRPTHPKLLDFLARRLIEGKWRIKDLHRMVMKSAAYRQASTYKSEAARLDGDSRFLWRFPPRRLSAEEIRDTILQVAGKLNTKPGGPGFRLYKFMQDNVCTYVPLDAHGPETYRRAVYHQNARASVVDLMTDFDQPDCAFSAPRRAATTTPLQALTMLNHSFTLDMAEALAERLKAERDTTDDQIQLAHRYLYARDASADEIAACGQMIDKHGMVALCRVLLNTSEMIYVQ